MIPKSRLRAEKLLERLQQHPLEKQKKDELICKTITLLPEFQKSSVVLLFAPIHNEVDLTSLFQLNKKFVLPRVHKKNLALYYVKNPEDTEKGIFHIPEPKKHLPRASFESIGLALVPGIVFDCHGHRIGYGKGFYDRLFRQLKCFKIGVAYGFQIVDNIPWEHHDIPMDMLVTEQSVIHTTHIAACSLGSHLDT